jgi:membrane protease YdiL (CAAX protease family)
MGAEAGPKTGDERMASGPPAPESRGGRASGAAAEAGAGGAATDGVEAALEAIAAWAVAGIGAFAAFRWLGPVAAPFANVAVWVGAAVVPIVRSAPPGKPVAAALERAGIAWARPLRSVGLAAAYSIAVLPAFALAFLLLEGIEGWRWPGAAPIAVAFAYHLFFSALPEEAFFRGLVQARLAAWWSGTETRRILRVLPMSPAILGAAALFALTHVVLWPSRPERIATFFPGLLFGALREESGDVVAPSLFHAACNAVAYGLELGYGPA